ncbi:MAG: hypothetical protein NXI04_28375 [Planctomycetaceae bacterium]|nr:hypothetical protein [Planctomycetaceae bacterium]
MDFGFDLQTALAKWLVSLARKHAVPLADWNLETANTVAVETLSMVTASGPRDARNNVFTIVRAFCLQPVTNALRHAACGAVYSRDAGRTGDFLITDQGRTLWWQTVDERLREAGDRVQDQQITLLHLPERQAGFLLNRPPEGRAEITLVRADPDTTTDWEKLLNGKNDKRGKWLPMGGDLASLFKELNIELQSGN